MENLRERLVENEEIVKVGDYSLEFLETIGKSYKFNLEYLILVEKEDSKDVVTLEDIRKNGLF